MTIGLIHYLVVAAILFTMGVLGIFLNRKNLIVILMAIELILLVGMVAAIALTMREGKDSKHQKPAEQVRVKKADRLRVVKVAAQVEAPVEVDANTQAGGQA